MSNRTLEDYVFAKLASSSFSNVLRKNGMKEEFIKQAEGGAMDLFKWLSNAPARAGRWAAGEIGSAIRETPKNLMQALTFGGEGPGPFASKKRLAEAELKGLRQARRSEIAKSLVEKRRSLRLARPAAGTPGMMSQSMERRILRSEAKALKAKPLPAITGKGTGILSRTGRALGRGLNFLFAAETLGSVYDSATRKRRRNAGMFESLGRRTGEIGSALSLYSPGAVGSGAFAYELGAQLVGAPSIGELGASAGRAVDTGVNATRRAAGKIRSIFGGGQNFDEQRRRALGNVRRPKAKINEGNKYNLKADYND